MYQYLRSYISAVENIKLEKKTAVSGVCEREHTHEFVELVYVFAGRAIQHIDATRFEVKRGDLFYVDYQQSHAYETVEAPYVYMDILIDPKIISEELLNAETIPEIFAISMFDEFSPSESVSIQCAHFTGKELLDAETLITAMHNEFEGKKVGYLTILSGYIRVLFSLLLRVMGKEMKDDRTITDGLLADVIAYINLHCCEKISLTELAKMCFYSPAHFSRSFKKYCGKSLSQYVKERRIAYAIELLNTTDQSVDSISAEVGYEDKASFHRTFREVTGETPAAFRKKSANQTTNM